MLKPSSQGICQVQHQRLQRALISFSVLVRRGHQQLEDTSSNLLRIFAITTASRLPLIPFAMTSNYTYICHDQQS